MVLVSYCCALATPVRLCATFEGDKIECVHSRHLALCKKKIDLFLYTVLEYVGRVYTVLFYNKLKGLG